MFCDLFYCILISASFRLSTGPVLSLLQDGSVRTGKSPIYVPVTFVDPVTGTSVHNMLQLPEGVCQILDSEISWELSLPSHKAAQMFQYTLEFAIPQVFHLWVLVIREFL